MNTGIGRVRSPDAEGEFGEQWANTPSGETGEVST